MDASVLWLSITKDTEWGRRPPFIFFKHLKSYAMGKMGQIAAMVEDGRSEDLNRMIAVAERTGRNAVFFLGKQYTVSDAKQILIFMQDAERKIHRDKQSSQ